MTSSASGIGEWFRVRIGWDELKADLASRRVPSRSALPYLGAAAATLLGLLLGSGVLLLLYYQPSTDAAHASVARIAGELPFGGLVRAVHYHSANLLLVTVAAQLFAIIAHRAYTPPRELVWVSAAGVFLICGALAFTGAILPWSEVAYAQASIGSRMAGYVPVVGSALEELLRGGPNVSAPTLERAFGFHVAVLPASLTVLVALHLYLLRATYGHAQPERGRRLIPLYPDLGVRVAAVAVGMVAIVVTLAVFLEPGIGVPIDPTTASNVVGRPAWYLLFVHQLLRSAPPYLLGVESPTFIGGALTLVFALVMAIPFIDRRGSAVTVALTSVALGIIVLLTAHALL
jgi:quinol-cytochrome oxidoreductase complex cytochrome b subunit